MNNTGLTLIDIGAGFDIEPRWKRIEPFLNYVGFEPDQRSRFDLNSKNNNCLDYKITPYAVWDTLGHSTLIFCRIPGTSSHFKPNQPFLDLFPDSRRFDILETLKLDSTIILTQQGQISLSSISKAAN